MGIYGIGIVMQKGEWVQEYTKRGSPMRGRLRWRSASEKRSEVVGAVVIVVAIVLPILLRIYGIF